MILGTAAIAIVGAESVGKTTLALMLAGRLRTHGVEALYVAEPGGGLGFDPARFDREPELHDLAMVRTMHSQYAAALTAGIRLLVCDRTPLDFMVYQQVKHPRFQRTPTGDAARSWGRQYTAVYFMPAAGTPYVEDGRRAAAGDNTWRAEVDALFRSEVSRWRNGVEVPAELTLRERMEWVYHHALEAQGVSAGRPARAYAQIRAWLAYAGVRVVEVRPQGSNSITRFHPPTDHDDIDALVIVDGDAAYALTVHKMLFDALPLIEGMVQATLDLLVCPRGCEPEEV